MCKCVCLCASKVAMILASGIQSVGLKLGHRHFFDTIMIQVDDAKKKSYIKAAAAKKINFRVDVPGALIIALDETVTREDLGDLLAVFDVVDSTKLLLLFNSKIICKLSATRVAEILSLWPNFKCC